MYIYVDRHPCSDNITLNIEYFIWNALQYERNNRYRIFNYHKQFSLWRYNDGNSVESPLRGTN